MARKKDPPKPISELRFDFVDSLENVCNQAMMLMQVVDAILRHHDGDKVQPLPPGIVEMLQQRSDAMRQALIGKDD